MSVHICHRPQSEMDLFKVVVVDQKNQSWSVWPRLALPGSSCLWEAPLDVVGNEREAFGCMKEDAALLWQNNGSQTMKGG